MLPEVVLSGHGDNVVCYFFQTITFPLRSEGK